MVNVNLQSKKKLRIKFSSFLILLLVLIVMVFAMRYLATRVFEGRINDIRTIKGYLFDSAGIFLSGDPKNDIKIIEEKKEQLTIERVKLRKQLKNLEEHVAKKEEERTAFDSMNSYLEDTIAMKSILVNIEYAEKTGIMNYYLVYDTPADQNLSPLSIPSIRTDTRVMKNIDFADLYRLQLVELEVGEENVGK